MASPKFNYYQAGISHVGSYQVSGWPYITGSTSIDSGVEDKISFPAVTKSVTVFNRSAVDLRVHFKSDSDPGNVISGLHYITLPNSGDSFTFNVKCKEIYITSQDNGGAYELYAQLTNINTTEMTNLTGSGLTD